MPQPPLNAAHGAEWLCGGGIYALKRQKPRFQELPDIENTTVIPSELRWCFWQITLTLIKFQEGVHFRRRGGAVVFWKCTPFVANVIP